MPTKAELEKQVKELKAIIRQLKKEKTVAKVKPEDLPESSFCVTAKDKTFMLYELRLDPETNEIAIVEKKKINTRDVAIALHRAKKHLTYQVMGKDRSVL